MQGKLLLKLFRLIRGSMFALLLLILCSSTILASRSAGRKGAVSYCHEEIIEEFKRSRSTKIIAELAQLGYNFNSLDYTVALGTSLKTLLMLAVERNLIHLVISLLTHGADPTIKAPMSYKYGEGWVGHFVVYGSGMDASDFASVNENSTIFGLLRSDLSRLFSVYKLLQLVESDEESQSPFRLLPKEIRNLICTISIK